MQKPFIKRLGPGLLLLVVWLCVFAVPRSQDYVASLIHPWPEADSLTNPESLSWDEESLATMWRQTAVRYQTLLEGHPKDENLLVSAVIARRMARKGDAFGALLRRRPGDTLVIALQLETLTDKLADHRQQGPLTNPNTLPKPPPPIQVLTDKEKRAFARIIELVRQGQRLEPNNTYFDWYLIYALFALRRDEEAMRAFENAARKTGYRDFMLAKMQVEYRARRLERRLSPNEVWTIANFGNLYNFYPIPRQTARFVMEMAMAEREHGATRTALRHAQELVHLGRLMRLRESTEIGATVGRAVEGIALLSWVPYNRPTLGRRRVPSLAVTDNLAGIAQANGQPKVARQAMAEWGTLQRWRAAVFPAGDVWRGVGIDTLFRFVVLNQGAGLLIWITRWLLPLWLLLLLLSRVLKIQENEVSPTGGRAAVWGGILSILSLALLLAIDLLIARRGQNMNGDIRLDYQAGAGLAKFASWWIAGLPILLLVWMALFMAVRWQRAQSVRAWNWKDELTKMGASEALLNVFVTRMFPAVARFSLFLLLGGFMVWFFAFAELSSEYFFNSCLLFVVFVLALLVSPLWAMRVRPRRRDAARLWVLTLRSAAGGFLVASWLCLGLVLLAAVPALLNFDVGFEHYIQVGEMPLLRALVGL